MGFFEKLKDAVVPRTAKGVRYRCVECGDQFDEAREECPTCGSTDIKEEEGFELRPQA